MKIRELSMEEKKSSLMLRKEGKIGRNIGHSQYNKLEETTNVLNNRR